MKRSHLDYRMHALEGMPQCAYCKRVYTTWKGFQYHMEAGCQEMPQPNRAPSSSSSPSQTLVSMTDSDLLYLRSTDWGRRLLDMVATENWASLKTDADVKRALCNHCSLCGAWMGRINELMTHLRETHPAYVPTSCQKGAQLEQVLREGTPCVLCNKPWKDSHLCPVTLQIGMLMVYRPRSDTIPPRALHCELCHQQLPTSEAMQDHLRNVWWINL